MATQIFVNLPVQDLNRSVDFFTKMGFSFNPQFTDENATCMIVSDTIFVMLLREEFYKTFTKKALTDAKTSSEVIVSLSADSRAEVDEQLRKALDAGATTPNEPIEMEGMYGRSFDDPDGHHWEYMYMDLSAMTPNS